MQRPWLSAIVPSHNGERWLATALESVVAQMDPRIEVIVIDSSETIASLDIISQFSSRLNVKVYRRPDLLSWMEKTNLGVELAAGDWICMLHQDDLWLPNRCSEVSKWVAGHPTSVMHLHSAHIVDAAGKRLGTWHCPLPGGDRPIPLHLLLERLLVQEFIAIPTPTIRRDAYLRVGGLDERLWQTADWDLYLKLLFDGGVHYHPKPLACFRIHKNSLTMSVSRSHDYRSQMEIVLARYIDKLNRRYRETLRIATASIDVNVALAAASNGKPAHIIKALARVCGLGPRGIVRYL